MLSSIERPINKMNLNLLGKSIFAQNRANLFQRLMWRLAAPLPDRLFVPFKYFLIMGTWPNLQSPRTFTEKIQARKLYDRNPLYGVLVDKYRVKFYIEQTVGAQYVVPTYWVGTDISEAPWNEIKLPVIVKPTHASGLTAILRTRDDVAAFLKDNPCASWLSTRHHRTNREWAYSQVTPQLIVEQLLLDNGELPVTYCFDVFRGKIVQIDAIYSDDGHKAIGTYDPDWNQLEVSSQEELAAEPGSSPRPERLDDMKRLASEIGAGFDYIRVDLYSSAEWIKVGELTLYPSGGYEVMTPPEYDQLLGQEWENASRTSQKAEAPATTSGKQSSQLSSKTASALTN